CGTGAAGEALHAHHLARTGGDLNHAPKELCQEDSSHAAHPQGRSRPRGKDPGLVGEVIAVYPERNRVTVAGVNIVKRHLRDTSAQPQARQTTKGGIVSSEAPIDASNVQLVFKNSEGEEVVTRIGYDRVEVTKRRPDGSEYKSTRSV